MKTKSILSLCGASTRRHTNLILAAAIIALLGSPPARAADITWSGLTSEALNVSANWVGSPTLAPTTDVWVFGAAGPGGTTLTDPGGMAGMNFLPGAPAYTLGTTANNITWAVTSSTITNSSGNTQTLNMGLTMPAARNFAGTGDFILNGALTGNGNIGKKGTGNLTITGIANTLSNNINVTENGSLTFGAVGDVGAKNTGGGAGGNFSITNATLAAAPGVVTSGGNSSIQRLSMNTGSKFTMADGVFNTFEVTSTTDLFKTAGTTPVYTFNLGGTASADVLALTLAPGFTNAGPKINITPVSALTIGSSYTVVTAPSGLDSANAFVLGTGIAVLGNTAYTLSITNSATSTSIGVVSADLAKAYYSGAQGTTLNAGTPGVSTNWLDAPGGGTDTLIQPSPVTELHFSATGASNTTIANLGQDYSAFSLNFNSNAGSVSINDTGANKITVGVGGIIVTADTHAINVPLVLSASQSFSNSGAGLLTIGGNIDCGGNILTGTGATNITIDGDIANLGGFVKDGAGVFTINGDISGSGGVTKNGAGILTLTGNNTYLGATNINLGNVSIPSFAALGLDTNPIATGLSGAAGIIYTGSGETVTRNFATSGLLANTLTINQSGTGLLKIAGDIIVATDNNRSIILDGSTAGTGEISSVITEINATKNTQVLKNGSGTWTLSAANTHSNNTRANAGTLILSNNLSIQNSSLDTTGLGVVDLTGATTPTFGGLTGATDLSAVITTGYGSVTSLTLNPFKANYSFVYSGIIPDGAPGMTLTKTGLGTQTLSGANSYTGNTTVNAGSFVLASTGQLKFITGATSGTGHNILSDAGAGTITLDGSFLIDTSATDASALTSGTWQIENAASLPGAYGGNFTVVGWTDAGSDTWTTTVGAKNYTFDETTGTVSMIEGPSDPYLAWITTYEPNALLPDAASKLPSADPDGDGFNNLLEFTLGGSPVVSSQSILPNQTVDATDITLKFKRSDASESPVTTQTVQISTDLVDWTTIPAIPIGPISGGGVTVTEGVNPTDPDEIIVIIPRGGSLKKFVRINVVK